MTNEQHIKNLKKLEDSQNLPENKFHNTSYIDNAGVKTIGIGHKFQKGDKEKPAPISSTKADDKAFLDLHICKTLLHIFKALCKLRNCFLKPRLFFFQFCFRI